MEHGRRLSAVINGNQIFELTRAVIRAFGFGPVPPGRRLLGLRNSCRARFQRRRLGILISHFGSVSLTGKTSWNRAPFLPSDNAESLPS
jgi:hypothetical protein